MMYNFKRILLINNWICYGLISVILLMSIRSYVDKNLIVANNPFFSSDIAVEIVIIVGSIDNLQIPIKKIEINLFIQLHCK